MIYDVNCIITVMLKGVLPHAYFSEYCRTLVIDTMTECLIDQCDIVRTFSSLDAAAISSPVTSTIVCGLLVILWTCPSSSERNRDSCCMRRFKLTRVCSPGNGANTHIVLLFIQGSTGSDITRSASVFVFCLFVIPISMSSTLSFSLFFSLLLKSCS